MAKCKKCNKVLHSSKEMLEQNNVCNDCFKLMEEKSFAMKTSREYLFYAATHSCVAECFIEIELGSDIHRKEEEELIDDLMEKFYKDYNAGMQKIIKESQMSQTKDK